MWDGKELKARGRAAFQINYWKCVAVALVLTLIMGGSVVIGRGGVKAPGGGVDVTQTLNNLPPQLLGALGGALVGVAGIGFVARVLVTNPLKVGCKRFFLDNSEGGAELDAIGCGFTGGYGRVVVGMLLRDVFLVLWFALFLIPGFVKAYSYRLVPYILADDPNIGGREAIDLSRRMMNGNKLRTFLLDLSFFGWYFLAAITVGLVNVLWTQPYTEATGAELYKAIKSQYQGI